jgi:anhydro-N-acetylmuramic acid kinase
MSSSAPKSPSNPEDEAAGPYHLGLMSGTSMDAVDAAIVDFHAAQPRLVATCSTPLPADLRAALADLTRTGSCRLDELGQLDVKVGRLFAEAALAAVAAAGLTTDRIQAIGSHGQTVWHQPGGEAPFTLQIGDPNIIAEQTGITVVADLRRRDVAAGGQGAPLVPAFHAQLFRTAAPGVAVNIGGFANLTVLPGSGEPVVGFDTGPGNVLLDGWVQRHLGQAMDSDGAWARGGRVDPALLDRLLADPFFAAAPPKSTGREYFNLAWLDSRLGGQRPEDVQATLTELTARSIADAIRRHAATARVAILCGGGSYNGYLRERLVHLLAGVRVTDSHEFGIAPQWIEAAAFAWLARETLAGRPGNLPSVTGARRPVVLGGIYPGSSSR